MIKRNLIILAIAALAFTSCKKQEELMNGKENEHTHGVAPTYEPNSTPSEPMQPPANGKFPVMVFENNAHDFGVIGPDKKVSYTFNFKNTGEANLMISNAVGSCGCTVPEYPKEPIQPGESGKILVTFSPTGKNGNQQKRPTPL